MTSLLCRAKLAGFGEDESAKKQTQGARKVIPKIENTFNAEEYSRQKKQRCEMARFCLPNATSKLPVLMEGSHGSPTVKATLSVTWHR